MQTNDDYQWSLTLNTKKNIYRNYFRLIALSFQREVAFHPHFKILVICVVPIMTLG
jgi:hypothetical protein